MKPAKRFHAIVVLGASRGGCDWGGDEDDLPRADGGPAADAAMMADLGSAVDAGMQADLGDDEDAFVASL